MLIVQRWVRIPLATAALLLTVFSLNSAPVGAHATEVNQGQDYAVTSASHASGYVCEREADGHPVVAK